MKEIISYISDGTSNKAIGRIISCSNDKCKLYKKGLCLHAENTVRCPFSKFGMEVGYSKRSNKYDDWVKSFIEKHKDSYGKASSLSIPRTIVDIDDEYIYFKIYHWNVKGEHKNVIIDSSGYLSDSHIILKKDTFTPKFIANEIIGYKAYSWFGGEITDYRDKEVPKFIRQLKSYDIDLYNKVKELCEGDERFENISNVGRYALLKTLNPNIGEFIISNDTFTYDGKYLITKCRNIFVINGKFKEIKIEANDDFSVKITDDNQVNKNTVFID